MKVELVHFAVCCCRLPVRPRLLVPSLLPSLRQANFKISTNVQFELLNPGKCFQPNATAEKLEDMYNAVRKKLRRMRRKFTKIGVGEPFWNFCGGDGGVPNR